jgi:hypothetical protein
MDLGSLLGLYEGSEQTRSAVSGNVQWLKCIRGGLRMAERYRLAFGVAYFTLLRAWIDGQFDAPVRESTTREQAHDLLAGSLRTLGRTRIWEEVLQEFLRKA